ncbi:MAG: ankyrin repeat domain-containing protein [Treponema sp.]
MKKLLVSFVVLAFGVSIFSASREEALFKAVRDNDVNEVEYQLEYGADPSYVKNDESLLMLACKNENKEIVRLLLNKGANASYRNSSDQTAIMIASKECKNTDIIKMLIIDGHANINAKDGTGKTVLMYVVQNPDRNVAASFLDNYSNSVANYNHVDNNGMTALMYIAKENRPRLLELFLRKCPGAEWTTTNDEGDNVLTLAIKTRNIDIVRVLINNIPGFDIDKKLPNGQPPLFWAIDRKASVELIEYLINCYRPEILLSTTDEFGNGIKYYAKRHPNARKIIDKKVKLAEKMIEEGED